MSTTNENLTLAQVASELAKRDLFMKTGVVGGEWTVSLFNRNVEAGARSLLVRSNAPTLDEAFSNAIRRADKVRP